MKARLYPIQNCGKLLRLLAAILLLSSSFAVAESGHVNADLKKACAELGDFYSAYLESCSAPVAASSEARTNGAAAENFDIVDHFRKTIQFSERGDTIWVKVAITVNAGDAESTVAELSSEGVRRITRFGSLITGVVPVQNLPVIDELAAVERIEPITPSAYSARTSLSSTTSAATIFPSKKK